MWYADTIGLKKVHARIREFQQRLGNWWEPAPLLQRLAEQVKTFAEFASRQGAAASNR
jgi:3-hydroxyacyl-CoA dehydrogenase